MLNLQEIEQLSVGPGSNPKRRTLRTNFFVCNKQALGATQRQRNPANRRCLHEFPSSDACHVYLSSVRADGAAVCNLPLSGGRRSARPPIHPAAIDKTIAFRAAI